ncbi:MAG: hypothetical protein GY847_36180 [Proteobacteria bacterium]|nr:hypothetical protein [Pseudomonadota bacterium]
MKKKQTASERELLKTLTSIAIRKNQLLLEQQQQQLPKPQLPKKSDQ